MNVTITPIPTFFESGRAHYCVAAQTLEPSERDLTLWQATEPPRRLYNITRNSIGMSMHPDITIYGPGQNPLLSVEVLTGVSPPDSNWVAEFRQHMVKRGFEPITNYFLLILPDKGFLWRNVKDSHMQPDFEFDMKLLLEPFLGKRDVHRISEQALTMAVYGWLDELTTALDGTAMNNDAYGWLVSSGLYDLLKKNSSMILIEART